MKGRNRSGADRRSFLDHTYNRKMTIIKKQFVPLVSNEVIDSFERELGYKLPTTYRNFLSEYNGGEPFNCGVISSDGFYADVSIRYFFSVSQDPTFGLAHKYAIYSGAGRTPREMLPVGGDVGGNLILLALAGPKLGSVFFWDHDIEGLVDDPNSPRHLRILADTFDGFIAGLSPTS